MRPPFPNLAIGGNRDFREVSGNMESTETHRGLIPGAASRCGLGGFFLRLKSPRRSITPTAAPGRWEIKFPQSLLRSFY